MLASNLVCAPETPDSRMRRPYTVYRIPHTKACFKLLQRPTWPAHISECEEY